MTKKIIIAIVIIVLGIIAFSMLSSSKTKSTASLSSSGEDAIPTINEGDVGEEFLSTLLNLNSIELNESVFNDQTFRSLKDFTITLIPETNVGRENPFAPIGTDEATPAGTFIDTKTTGTTTGTQTTTSPVTPPSSTTN